MTGPQVRRLEVGFDVDLADVSFGNKAMTVARSGAEAGLWWPVHTPDGLGTLHLAFEGDRRHLRAEAFGDGAAWLLEQVPALVGVDDRPDELVVPEPLRRRLRERGGPPRFGRTDRVFEAMIESILGQKIQSALAGRIRRALVWAHGDPAPGAPRLRAFPSAARIAELAYHDFHRFDLERRRAETLMRVAREGDRLERLVALPGPEAAARMERLAGIGPWTTGWVRWIAFGDADAVITGDYHLPHSVGWNLAGEARGSDERMLELLAPYAGHRGRLQRGIKLAGERAPRYGPRLGFREFSEQ